jgi:hypothetical protein
MDGVARVTSLLALASAFWVCLTLGGRSAGLIWERRREGKEGKRRDSTDESRAGRPQQDDAIGDVHESHLVAQCPMEATDFPRLDDNDPGTNQTGRPKMLNRSGKALVNESHKNGIPFEQHSPIAYSTISSDAASIPQEGSNNGCAPKQQQSTHRANAKEDESSGLRSLLLLNPFFFSLASLIDSAFLNDAGSSVHGTAHQRGVDAFPSRLPSARQERIHVLWTCRRSRGA